MGRKSRAKKNRPGPGPGTSRRAAGGISAQATARLVEIAARAERQSLEDWRQERDALRHLAPPPIANGELGAMCDRSLEPPARNLCHWRARSLRTMCRTIVANDDGPATQRRKVDDHNRCAWGSGSRCRLSSQDTRRVEPGRAAPLRGLFTAALLSAMLSQGPETTPPPPGDEP